MNPIQLTQLLKEVQDRSLSIPQALRQLRTLPYENVGFASVDHHRALRQGFPEVLLCEGKTNTQIVTIAKKLLKSNGPFLATRADPSIAKQLVRLHRKAVYHKMARIVAVSDSVQKGKGHVVLVTAGTSDIPVAEEARVTAEVMGSHVTTLYDVGVAGIHRLLDQQDILYQGNVVIVVAGMDGVLPSVVGGLIDRPIVAVPTSQGYGANFGGLAPLLTMLNACSSGIGVVNIDNGFGAGCLAHRINVGMDSPQKKAKKVR
jgi:NCAIR mutase (PurE)-related protein